MYELSGTEEGGALSWQERALCAQTDPEAFFPEKGGSTREAKKVCLACDVRGECLEYALANDERFGIWGGLSERERRKLKTRAVQPRRSFDLPVGSRKVRGRPTGQPLLRCLRGPIGYRGFHRI
jgi:WhiB family transcriptional regulator, redox-sensing transcriptional regulator